MGSGIFGAYGVYSEEVDVTQVLEVLSHAGFEAENTCLILSCFHPIAKIVREATVNTEEERSRAASSLIQLLSGLGAVVIPTYGFFIRSQEFFHNLIVKEGAMADCGGSASLRALGLPEATVEEIGSGVKKRAAVYVSCSEASKEERVLELLQTAGADVTGSLTVKECFFV